MPPFTLLPPLLLALCLPASANPTLQQLPAMTQEPVPIPIECRRDAGCPRPPSAGGLVACTTYFGNGVCENYCNYNVVSYLTLLRGCPPFAEPGRAAIDSLKHECRAQCRAARAAIAQRKKGGLPFAPAVVFSAVGGGGGANGTAGAKAAGARGGFKLFRPMREVKNRCAVVECDKPEGCVKCPPGDFDEYAQACWLCAWTGVQCDAACEGGNRWEFEL